MTLYYVSLGYHEDNVNKDKTKINWHETTAPIIIKFKQL